MVVYSNLPQLVERDLKRIHLAPPISISNVSDPCQDVPEVKDTVRKLVRLILSYKVPFFITSKGDPRFLLEIDGFSEYEFKFVAITIEGTDDILSLLSPGAPPFKKRLEALSELSNKGVNTLVRLDPLFYHLFYALYGKAYFKKLEGLVRSFAQAGAKHIVSSTGRLSRRRPIEGRESSWERMLKVVRRFSPSAARMMEREYAFERRWGGSGLFLKEEIRLKLHTALRELAESYGMTYAVCQELGTEADSVGIAHCERFVLPFVAKKPDGTFAPIPSCTATCHLTCKDKKMPPCGQPQLASPSPFKLSYLRRPVKLHLPFFPAAN